MRGAVRMCCGVEAEPVEVNDRLADPSDVFRGTVTEVVAYLCPVCFKQIETAQEHLDKRLRTVAEIAEGFSMDDRGNFRVSKAEYDAYMRAMRDYDEAKALFDAQARVSA